MVGQRKRPVAEKDSEEVEDESMNEEEKMRLIGLVQKYPVLWNVKCKGFRDNLQTANGWGAIGETMEVNGKLLFIELPVQFYSQSFSGNLQKGLASAAQTIWECGEGIGEETRSGAGFVQKPVWPFWEEMQFVHDTIARLPCVFRAKYCCDN
jgi:hypothetical protein